MRMVIVNLNARSVSSINFEGLTDIHYVVLVNEKFEPYWNDLKDLCKLNFVNPHIHFIIPCIVDPKEINNFALAFGVMLGEKNPRLHND